MTRENKKNFRNYDASAVNILKLLSYGCALKDRIFEEIQNIEPISRPQFNRVISYLEQRKYLKIKKYPDPQRIGKHTLILFLTKTGINHVCNVLGALRDFIRTAVPKSEHLQHEISITKIYQVIVAEHFAGHYKLITIEDDTALRKKNGGKKMQGTFLPDFKIEASAQNFNKGIIVELDNGQKSESYWKKKISYLIGKETHAKDQLVILVASNPERIKVLWEYLPKHIDTTTIYIAVSLNAFCKVGLSHFIEVVKSDIRIGKYDYEEGKIWHFTPEALREDGR